MIATPLIATVAPNAAAAPAAAPSPQAGSDDANGFARQLEQAHQSGPAASTPATANAGTAEDAQAKPAPKAARRTAEAHADKGEGSDKAADAGRTTDTAQPADLASLLAGLMAPAAARTAPVAASAAAASAQGPGTTASTAATSGRGASLAARDGTKDKLRAGLGKDGSALPGDGKPVADTLPQDTKLPVDAAATPIRPEALAALQAPVSHAAQAVADSAARSIGAPVQAQVAAPLGSPEFAPALGAQVSVLVRDGVQEARLQLNPAEMGPITVQIQLDGSNARVNMAAEHHQTRQALEQAMPSLAGALRENGLTLTGGGVFEQPRPPRDGSDAQAAGSGRAVPTGTPGDDTAVAGASVRPAASRARGVLDLYA
ncbi:MAG: hypothetical protein ABT20_03305 [Rubrivivax sp. SCN 70-15]|nr:MAG: hypothetical protein ABT20_03305 [Rubrivivax sp. SCN 70-15]